jgi:CRP/FNR family transcriptional regulator/CRP/FNR family cyclic AMP-dependent transcriptional regulator
MKELLRTVTLFNKLSDDQLESIYRLCVRKTYGPGTVLIREKEVGGSFYILVIGSVKIYTTSPGAGEKILTVLNPGDSFGELAIIDGKPRSASAETLEESTVLAVDGNDFLRLLKDNFDITLGIMQELAHRLRVTNEHVHDLTFLDARTRVIKQLILLANRAGKRTGNTIHVRMALNYPELSTLAGVPQQKLMEFIRDFQERQLLTFVPDGFVIDLSKIRG